MIPTPAQKAYSDAIRLALRELGDQRVAVSVTCRSSPKPLIPLERVLEEKKER